MYEVCRPAPVSTRVGYRSPYTEVSATRGRVPEMMRTDAKAGVGPKPDEGWTLIVVSPGSSHVTDSANMLGPAEFNWFPKRHSPAGLACTCTGIVANVCAYVVDRFNCACECASSTPTQKYNDPVPEIQASVVNGKAIAGTIRMGIL